MKHIPRLGWVGTLGFGLTAVLAIATSPGVDDIVFAQAFQNPYRFVDGWAQLSGGRPMGASARQ